ncbi:SpoIIE family protein phosphatase [Actinoallomurus spadix]|uniref:SpoIIE family protein phosphatase n=1 Tax=Actinoallomurus spadix TaxID=79912 RepID=A0ABP3FE10_9ACTN|nr:ATP-binding protein [Actinoallomurus spadix]MCO5990781.1 SpoIIE family protein phosphatase [Actinoallomurus spadix]
MSLRVQVGAGWDIPVSDESQVHGAVAASTSAARVARLDARSTARCELLATELATNLVKHAYGGRLLVSASANGVVQLITVDRGPGIPDVAVSMADGYTTTSSLGGGLGTCRRAATEFDLYSRPGQGTVVLARIGAADEEGTDGIEVGGVLTPHPTQSVAGDGYGVAWEGDRLTAVVVDGLGHGPAAAEARQAALDVAGRRTVTDVARLLREIDTALRTTRGAAAAVAQVDGWARRLTYGCTGNVTGRLYPPREGRSLLCVPGILGAGISARSHRVDSAGWTSPALLVLHTDGINGRWRLEDYPQVDRHHPAVLAALIWRDAHRGNDDATVVVIRTPTDKDPR